MNIRLSLCLLILSSSLVYGKTIDTLSVNELQFHKTLVTKGKKKYTGFAYGKKFLKEEVENHFYTFFIIPEKTPYPLDKLHRVDSIYCKIQKGQMVWMKGYKQGDPFVEIRYDSKDPQLSHYSYYGTRINGKSGIDTSVFAYEWTLVNHVLNGPAIVRSYNHGIQQYETRDIISFKEGLIEGEHLWFYPSAEGKQILKSKSTFKSGKKQGVDSTWTETGKLQSVVYFENGKMEGEGFFYYGDGKSLRSKNIYKEGDEVAYYQYTFNGKMSSKKENGEFTNIPLSGEVVIENLSGQLIYKTLQNAPSYANDGEVKLKTYDGRLLEVWNYKNGMLHGTHIKYDFQGNELMREEYKEGSKISN